MTSVTQTAESVEAELEGPDGTRRVKGCYIIGADGAGSLVRRVMEMDLKGETYPATSLTIAVGYPFDEHIEGLLPVNYCWTKDSHFSMMQLKNVWRVGYSPKPGQSYESALKPEQIQARLQEIHPRKGPYDIVHAGAYTIHRRVAGSFRVGTHDSCRRRCALEQPFGRYGHEQWYS